jgi:hypothetical protein
MQTMQAINNNSRHTRMCKFGNRWCLRTDPCKDCKIFLLSSEDAEAPSFGSRFSERNPNGNKAKRGSSVPKGELFVDNFTPIRISFREATAKQFSNDIPFINFWIKPTTPLSKCIKLYTDMVGIS